MTIHYAIDLRAVLRAHQEHERRAEHREALAFRAWLWNRWFSRENAA